MKIVAFTAGAGPMYCGSCIRDNALAAEIRSEGHDISLWPIYTPTLTDEPNLSEDKVFCGGISVYLEQHASLFRKTPWLLDRIWDSKTALRLASRRSIPVDPKFLGELTVSMLRGEDGFQRKEIRKLTSWLRSAPRPDIITLPNSLLIGLASPIRQALGRPICCTLQGEDLFLRQLQDPYRAVSLDLIRANISQVDAFAAVSEYYRPFMRDYLGIPEDKLHVVPLGINLDGYDVAPRPRNDTFRIGYFARVAPEKGLHLLAQTYIHLRRSSDFSGTTLDVAGYLAPEHRGYLRDIEGKLRDAGLHHEFHYRGILDRPEKIGFIRSLDVLSVPSTYDEPKGIFLLEAMAGGVPVIQPRRGAFPEILEKTGGGILVEPDDASSLAEGILSLWKNPALREELGRKGAKGVREHYSASHMAARALQVYSSIVAAHAYA